MLIYVEILEGFELIFLVHIVLGHDLFELGARHVHTTPSVIQVKLRILHEC